MTIYYAEFSVRNGQRVPVTLFRRLSEGSAAGDGRYDGEDRWQPDRTIALWLLNLDESDIEEITEDQADEFIERIAARSRLNPSVTNRKRDGRSSQNTPQGAGESSAGSRRLLGEGRDMFDLDAWAARWRMMSFPKAMVPGDILAYGDMELLFIVAERAGNWVVEERSRSGPRMLLGTFATKDDAMRLFVYSMGGRDPALSGPGIVGATIEVCPTATRLSWPGGSAEFSLGLSGTLMAERFSWMRGRSLQEIANAF